MTSHFATPLVSVVICFYNMEPYIRETLESVLAQTYPHWEAILVDDGSADGSTAIARDYAGRYPEKILYVEHPGHRNLGVSASRNRGIECSRGELVALLDADDIWLPERLEEQVELVRRYPEAAVFLEATLYWYSWNDPSRDDIRYEVGIAPGREYRPPALMRALYPLGKGDPPCLCGLMARREAMMRSRSEESFRGEYQGYEDQALLCKLYLRENIYVSGTCNNMYRLRKGSVCASMHEEGNYHRARSYYLNWLEGFLENEPNADREVRALLRRALLLYRHPFLHRILVGVPYRIKRAAGYLGLLRPGSR